jgi:hypothetical protein
VIGDWIKGEGALGQIFENNIFTTTNYQLPKKGIDHE